MSPRRVLILFLSTLLLPPLAPAQGTSPIHKAVWTNGLTVVTQADDASAVTVLEILFRGGRRAEPAGREGLSYLTTRLSLEIPDQNKAQELMEKSSRYMMTSRGDESLIHIECLTEFLDDTLAVFLEILDDPLFSGIRIERARDFMNNQRTIEADDGLSLAHLAQVEAILGPLGYGGSIFGTKDGLAATRTRDIQSYYEARYVPGNMVLVAVSDLGSAPLEAVLRKHFGRFKEKAKPLTPSFPSSTKPPSEAPPKRETVIVKETNQDVISLGYALPGVRRSGYAAALLLESLLGKGPGSRLWALRAERKLAYNVNAFSTQRMDGGLFEVYLESDSGKREEARTALRAAMRKVWEEGVTAEELDAAKAFARTDLLRANETKSRRATTLGTLETLGLGADHLPRLFDDLAAITLGDMNDLVRSVLDPDRAWFVQVGPRL
jgi:zinc protease